MSAQGALNATLGLLLSPRKHRITWLNAIEHTDWLSIWGGGLHKFAIHMFLDSHFNLSSSKRFHHHK
jgi:hypothetical protein